MLDVLKPYLMRVAYELASDLAFAKWVLAQLWPEVAVAVMAGLLFVILVECLGC